MYRIDNATAADAPAPPPTALGKPEGYFSGGNPGTGTPATIVDAEWLNMMQEEGAFLVTSAGLALDKADRTQWSKAIDAKIAGAGGGPSPYVLKAGDVMTGDLRLTNPTNLHTTFSMDRPAAAFAQLFATTNGLLRWNVAFADATPETGGNAGSHFVINRFADDGAYIDRPLWINRETGVVDFVFMPSVLGVPIGGDFVLKAGDTMTGALTINAGAAGNLMVSGGVYAASDPNFGFVQSAGGRFFHWMAGWYDGFDMATGSRTWSNGTGGAAMVLDGVGNVWASGYLSAGTTVTAAGDIFGGSNVYAGRAAGIADFFMGVNTANGNRAICFQSTNASIEYVAATGGIYCVAAGSARWSGMPNTAFQVPWIGEYPGGGPWLPTASDARIKNVTGTFDVGLAELVGLQPKRYTFKGNDVDASNGHSPHGLVLEKEFIGLIAQEVEAVIPEMIIVKTGYVDGEEVDDLRTLDLNHLTYMMINAIKEIAARLTALETAAA